MWQTIRGTSIKHNAVTLDLSESGMDVITRGMITTGMYEKQESRLLKEWLPSGCAIVELGAGIGYLSCLSNQHAEPCVHVVAEPNPNLIPTLQEHRRINDCSFEVIEKAYHPDRESVSLNLQGSYMLGSIHRETDNSIEVEAISLEQIIDLYDLSEFTLIADIEGAEKELIRDETHLLSKYCSHIVIEYHPYFITDSDDIAKMKERLKTSHFDLLEYDEHRAVYFNTKLT
jgi:FkbM family methyltransferase